MVDIHQIMVFIVMIVLVGSNRLGTFFLSMLSNQLRDDSECGLPMRVRPRLLGQILSEDTSWLN